MMIEIPCYERFQLTLKNPDEKGNPFQNPAVYLHVTSPSGREVKIPGFYDGQNTWRIRFTPNEIGRWHYRTEWSRRSGSNSSDISDSLVAVNSGHQGFIRQSRTNRNYLAFDSGEHLYPFGDTCYNAINLTEHQLAAYLDTRKCQGFNFIRISAWATMQAEVLGPPPYWAWGGTRDNPDFMLLNPEYFARMDRVLDALDERGMYAEVVLFLSFYYPMNPLRDGWSPTLEKIWIDYLIARYSAYANLLMWTVANEYEIYPDGKYRNDSHPHDSWPSDQEWAREIAGYVHTVDPYRHLTSVHPNMSCNPDGQPFQQGGFFGTADEIDVLSHQQSGLADQTWKGIFYPLRKLAVNKGVHQLEGAGLEDGIIADRTYGKSVMVTEFFYEAPSPKQTSNVGGNINMVDAHTMRRLAWRIVIGGAAGLAAGFSGTWRGDPARLDLTDAGGIMYLKLLSKELAALSPWTLAPHNDRTDDWNLCMANPGQRYVCYVPRGGEMRLDLSDDRATFTVEWLNPHAGERTGSSLITGGRVRTLTPPDGQVKPVPFGDDWVLVLERV